MASAQAPDDGPLAGDGAGRLLSYLRTTLGQPALSYADAPARLSGGNETFIYSLRLQGAPEDLSRPLILRAYRAGYVRPEQARFESTIQNALAALGYPAPRAFLTCSDGSVLGTPFFIMERLPGTMMLELLRNPIAGRRVAAMLAETQARLHGLDTGTLQRALDGAGLSAAATVDAWFERVEWRIDKAALDGLRPGHLWLLEHRPAQPERLSICHGDFHVNNVLVYQDAVSGVIDWSLTKVADPAFDVGNTRVLMMLGPRDAPSFLQPILGLLTRNLARRYYGAYRKLRAVDASAVRYYEALRCLHSLVWAGEHRAAAANGLDLGPNPWAADRESSRLVSHFRRITGRTLQLPPVP